MKFSCPSSQKLKFAFFPIITLCLFFGFQACEGENVTPIELENVSEIIVADNGNVGDGSDIEVNFKKQLDLSPIKEYRLFTIKTNQASNFTLEQANSLGADLYTQIGIDETYPVKGKELLATTKDIDGDVIDTNQSYRFAILSVAKDTKASENKLAISTDDFQLRINNQLRNYTLKSSEIGAGNLLMMPSGELIMSEYNVQLHASNRQESGFNIYKVTLGRTFEEESGEYTLLTGSSFDADFNLYQSEYFGGRIFKKTPSGEITDIEHQGVTLFNPDGIYVDPNNNIFVADQEAGKIIKITPDGVSSQFAFIRKNPKGIAADENGNLYISHNDESGEISKITPDGTVSILASLPVFRPEGYSIPYKMWMGYIVYHEGDLYVAGMSTDRIYKISLDGQVSVFAGSGRRGLPRGGALSANLNRPNGLAFSNDGKKLYISGCTDITPSHTQYSTPGIIWEIDILEE